jgi:hypothetical protein
MRFSIQTKDNFFAFFILICTLTVLIVCIQITYTRTVSIQFFSYALLNPTRYQLQPRSQARTSCGGKALVGAGHVIC